MSISHLHIIIMKPAHNETLLFDLLTLTFLLEVRKKILLFC